MSEKNKIYLFNLLKEPGNNCCADCGEGGSTPDWASANLGIFLCIKCSGIHRNLGKTVSFVRSLRLDHWADDKCEFMASMGNKKANSIWAKNVPICWKRPTPLDHNLDFYVEEWIRAKYERKEFKEENENELHYCSGEKDGYLSKKDRNKNTWNPRYFRVSAQNCSLSYYIKKEDLSSKQTIDLKKVNVMLCDSGKTDKFFSMQISAPEEKSKGKKSTCLTRSIYVHAETGKDIVDWYLAIRAARFKVLQLNESDKDAGEILSSDYIKQGWLRKSGPKENDKYLSRWVTIERNKFSYSDDKLDAVPKNEVVLKSLPELYSVSEGVDGKHPDEPHPFMVQTPERVFNFSAETDKEMEDWIQAFRKGIELAPLQQQQHFQMSAESAASRFSHLSVSSSDSSAST